MSYRIGSLCSGVGALDLAVAAVVPADVAWHAEVDPDAATVLDAHWPGVPNLGDITTADWTAAPPIDVLTAGWPCQVASCAGKRRGSEDDRYLWPAVVEALAALRPQLFVGENVPGLLTIEKGAMFGRVLADLDMLGYSTAWTTLGACRLGFCHHRHRIYIWATLGDTTQPAGGGPRRA